MKVFHYFILVGMLAVASCGPGKEIAERKPDDYVLTALIRDVDGAISNVLNVCFQLQFAGPVEINQSNVGSDVVEMKFRCRTISNERMNRLRDELISISGFIRVTIK